MNSVFYNIHSEKWKKRSFLITWLQHLQVIHNSTSTRCRPIYVFLFFVVAFVSIHSKNVTKMSSQTKYTFHIQITVLGMAAVRCRRPCAVSPQLRYTFMTWRAHAVGSRHKHFSPTVNTSPRTDFAITVHRIPPVFLLSSCSCFAACLVTQTCSMLGEYAFRTGNQYHNHIGLSINLSTRYSWVSHILRMTLFRYTRHRIHEGLLFDFRRPPSLIICSLSRLAGTRLSSRYWSESRFFSAKARV